MTNQLKMMVGVAVFAALALAGALGVFAFAAVQPAQAQNAPSATRSFSPMTVAPGGTVTVTIAHANTGGIGRVTEMIPSGFTYQSSSLPDGNVNTDNAAAPVFSLFLAPASFTYDVTAPMTAGEYTFSGTLRSGDPPADHTVGGNTMVTVSADSGNGNGQTPMYGSVRALPEDPGAATQITVKFSTRHQLDIDESIVIEAGDDLGVPTSIAAGNVSIADGSNTASPRSVVVETDDVAERFKITLFIGDMSDVDGAQDLESGNITVTFRQEAGITNRTEGGDDDWFAYTSQDTFDEDTHQITDVYTVPFLVKLSSYGDARGEEITVTGLGFKNGTTVRFWRDADNRGTRDSGEVVLCSATAGGNDIATCSFTLSNPPFMPDTEGNYINAIDGRNNTATMDDKYSLPVIELEPSMSVDPKEGNPGDTVNIQLYDFVAGDMVSQIEFGRDFDICGGSKPACSFPAVGRNGGLSFNFEIPNGVTPGIQDLRVKAGPSSDPDARNDNTNFVVGAGTLDIATTDVLPNQRIHVSGSGFTTSSTQASAAWIGTPDDNSGCASGVVGRVTLGGDRILWNRVNNGDGIKVTSGGTWSAAIDLPVNSLTTSAGTHLLEVVDCLGGAATRNLTFPDPDVSMSPKEGRVGSEVIITGKNFPVSNDDSNSDVEITVTYASGTETDDDDVEPDGTGSFTVILEVPEDAAIPSSNTVTVQYTDDNGATVTETETHEVPQGIIKIGAASGAEGSMLSINAEGFDRYTSVDEVLFDNRDITPSPKPSTGTSGDVEFDVRIPGADPGVYIIEVTIDDVTASKTFTVVSGSGVVDGSVDSILANVMSEDALDRVFKFNNETKEWQWHINDPAFSSTNNLAGLSSGDLVWIKVTKDVTADILGTSTTLSCINDGEENEDCWNQISIP